MQSRARPPISLWPTCARGPWSARRGQDGSAACCATLGPPLDVVPHASRTSTELDLGYVRHPELATRSCYRATLMEQAHGDAGLVPQSARRATQATPRCWRAMSLAASRTYGRTSPTLITTRIGASIITTSATMNIAASPGPFPVPALRERGRHSASGGHRADGEPPKQHVFTLGGTKVRGWRGGRLRHRSDRQHVRPHQPIHELGEERATPIGTSSLAWCCCRRWRPHTASSSGSSRSATSRARPSSARRSPRRR